MDWTPPQLVNWICSDLEQKGFPPPHRSQAELLVSHALNMSRLDIYLQHDKPTTPAEQEKLRDLLKRRYKREPTAYILGHCDFWTLNFKVGAGVLIPRPDTEILVEAILDRISNAPGRGLVQILELGTGCAIIPLSLCSERMCLEFTCTDVSSEALWWAKINIDAHKHLASERKNRILLVQTDRFSAIHPRASYDFIVSNPPYIPDLEIPGLQKEVSEWEPTIALAGGKHGTDFYQFLQQAAIQFLKPSGYLIFEHGFDQAQVIAELMKTETELRLVENRKDYAGHDRVQVYQKISH